MNDGKYFQIAVVIVLGFLFSSCASSSFAEADARKAFTSIALPLLYSIGDFCDAQYFEKLASSLKGRVVTNKIKLSIGESGITKIIDSSFSELCIEVTSFEDKPNECTIEFIFPKNEYYQLRQLEKILGKYAINTWSLKTKESVSVSSINPIESRNDKTYCWSAFLGVARKQIDSSSVHSIKFRACKN